MPPQKTSKTREQLIVENEALRTKVVELEQTLQALQTGTVDAITIPHSQGEHIFTLQGAEQVYRVLIEKMSDGALTMSLDGIVLYSNQRFAGMLGLPLQRVIGSQLVDWLPPPERPKFEVLLQQVGEHSQRFEINLPGMNGASMVASIFADILSLGGQRIIYLVAVDLTQYKNKEAALYELLHEAKQARLSLLSLLEDRQATENQLRESELRFRKLIELSPVATIAFDETGKFELVNRKAVELFGGTSAEDFLGQPVIERVHPNYRARTVQRIAQAAATDDAVPFVETVFLKLDGKSFDVFSGGVPLLFHGKRIYVTSFLDITEKKQAEQALRDSEQRFSTSFQISPVGMIISRLRDGVFLELNDELERISGYTRAEMLGQSVMKMKLFADPNLRQQLAEQGVLRDVELQVKHKSGQWRWTSLSAQPIKLQGEECFLTVIRDIHEKKQFEDEKKQSETKFRALLYNSPLQSVVWKLIRDAQGAIFDWEVVDINPLGAASIGLEIDAAVGRRALDLFGAKVMIPYLELSRQVDATGQPIQLETYFKPNDRHYLASNFLLGNDLYANISLDITELKKAQADIESVARFPDENPNPVLRVNQGGEILYANKSSAHLLLEWGSTIGGYVPIFLQTQIAEVLAQQSSKVLEIQCGALIYQATLAYLDHPEYINLYLANITQRKRAENALQKLNQTLEQRVLERTESLADSEARLRFVLESCHIGTWDMDIATQLTTRSAEHDHVYGYETMLPEWTYEMFLQHVVAEDRVRVDATYQTAIRDQSSWNFEFRIRRPDGQLRWIWAAGSHKPDASGKPRRVAGVVLDITEQKLAEVALRENEERMNLAFSATQDGIWDWNLETDEVFYSSRYKSMLGYTEDELEPHISAWKRLLHPEDLPRAIQVVEEVLRGERDYVMEFRLLHKAGHYMDILSRGFPIHRGPNGSIVRIVGTHVDLTERKQTEESLRSINIELERAMRIKDEFLANMSHELRTPLSGILGMSEILLLGYRGPLNERQRQIVTTIDTSGHHLLNLINDILDLAKLDAEKLELHLESVYLKEICQVSLSFVKEQATKKGITLDLTLDIAASMLQADARRLKQILVNLLSNAVKFTPAKGKVTLATHLAPDHQTLAFSVSDTGIGIAPADLVRLFTPFNQVDNSMTRKYEGTGLGLSLVKRLVELHGGTISVESVVGQGSRFTVSLPWQEPAALAHLEINTPPAITLQPLPAPKNLARILLVEDNATNITVIGDYLDNLGYSMVFAHDGLEGLAKAIEYSPQVILMDIQMPNLDGLETMRRLRLDPQFAHTPIIALTAHAMTGDRERCLAAGATDYLSKPVNLEELSTKIKQLLG